MVAYSSQHILRQFDFDQGVAYLTEVTYVNVRDADFRFVGEGRENLLGTYSSFWSNMVREGVRSP